MSQALPTLATERSEPTVKKVTAVGGHSKHTSQDATHCIHFTDEDDTMGLQSALTTSLTGLQAAETSIDVVGNNVANSNTVGFKESDTIFATQFLQTISIGSAPNTGTGGTNPRQIGLGVKVAQISPDFSQGTIEISSNPLDVAIQGDGFLIVQGVQGEQLYTRQGQLNLNSLNEVTTVSGQRLLGYGVNDSFEIDTSVLRPLSIGLGQEQIAQPTENAILQGVLNPAAEVAGQPSISESAVLGNNAIESPDDTDFTADDFLVSPTPAVASLASGGGGGPAAGDYTYRIAFVDGDGNEGTHSTQFSISHTGGAIDLSSIEVPDGTNFVDRVIYRTEAGGSDFYRVGAISDSGDGILDTNFSDTVDDATLITNAALDDSTIDDGVYTYYVTYYNPTSQVETRPTTEIDGGSITELGGGRIRLNLADLQPPTDNGFTNLRIYRNTAGGSEFYRLPITGDLPAPTALTPATAYMDSFSNDEIEAAGNLINLDGPPAGRATLLTDLLTRTGDTYSSPFQEGTLSFSGKKSGVGLTPKEFTITPTSNVQDLIDFMEEALGIDPQSDIPSVPFPETGGVTITNGQLVVTSNLGEQNAVEITGNSFQLTPEGSNITGNVSLTFSETVAADGPGTATELTVYDSLGLPIKARITTVLESNTPNSTTYRWYATSAENEPTAGVSTVVGDGLLTFNNQGDLISGPANVIQVQRNDTASESPLEVELDFSTVKSLGATDAQGELISSLNFASQDGFPPGVLTDFIVTEDGSIQGQFSNGAQRTLGQLVMARFANNQGLQQVGDSLFARSVNSGEPILGSPGEGGIGTLTSGAVELSNTDIGQNLIELILASTQYRGGARVITAAQELLDELLALRR